MAKIRVYELARELKIESKKLVEELTAGGLDIKNYMSTLDEETVAKARDIIAGKVSEVVVEKRVKPRVIRRRKKIVQVKPKAVEEIQEPEQKILETPEDKDAVAEEPPVKEDPGHDSPEPGKTRDIPEKTAPEKDVAPKVSKVSEEVTVLEEPAVEKPAITEKSDEKASTVKTEEPPVEKSEKPVDSPAAVPEPSEEIPPSKAEVPDQPDKPDMKVAEPEPPVEKPEVKTKKPETEKAPVEEPPAEAGGRESVKKKKETLRADEKISKKKTQAPEKVSKIKAKKSKKKKSDRPAKIISPPEEGPLKNILAKKAEKESIKASARKPKRQGQDLPKEVIKGLPEDVVKGLPLDEKSSRKKKERKKTAPVDGPVKRGAVKRRKKEIYERADLYEDRGKKGKGRKGGKKSREAARKFKQTEITTPKAIKRRIKVQETVTVLDLAKAMGVKATELLKRLMASGVMANINQSIDFDTASLVADELGFELELDTFVEESFFGETADDPKDLLPRPPVVTIMGHVDHGKTSLLDYIRNSNIIGGESGGITQHIGAYYVKTDGGDIVFLDTPGHEAFTAMRARGAKVTDIIVLVVAADDGAMPQTREAINHARAADIPLVVAINKMDKANADPDRVKRELAELDLAPEEWGGDTLMGEISAKTGQGVDDLLNLILLQSEMLELKGNPKREARGSVIEAELDRSRGPVATVLIQNGTLEPGDQFVCGEHYGRVRAMLDNRGRKLEKAGPSVPVVLYGISGVPMAGDEFNVVKDEKLVKRIIEHRKEKSKKQEGPKKGLVSLDDLYDRIKDGDVKELNIILKADVQGSAEALAESLVKQGTDAVKLHVIHSATGGITESDVTLASASNAIIIGFNVRANPRVTALAEKENIDVRFYDVIYDAIKDIRLAMAGLLEPILKENVIGHAEVREVFRVPKVGAVAGCQVTDGHVERNAKARLLRDDVVVFDGKISSLRRFKDDVKEVQAGYECGIGFENFGDIKPSDIFEIYLLEEVAAEL